MKHLGDITKISGYTVPIVDCVIGGSPCQDLSVAGKRAGLDGERSGLFMEQVRIVKEMREQDAKDCRSDDDVRPRYMVWENVAGAFSSGKPKGEDFRIVLEELAKVADQNATIPRPDKWQTSGCVMGDGWSIAWRLLDAQFWGVPQRRRRIALVADFGGQSAAEILFVRKGVSGNTQPGEPKRKAASRNVENCAGADDCEGIPYTLKIRSGCEGGGKGALVQEDMSATLACNNDQYLFQPIGDDPYNGDLTGDKAATLGVNCGIATGRNAVIALDRASFNQGENAQFNFDINENGVNSPLVARGPGAVCYGVDCYNQALTGDKAMTLRSKASDSDHIPCAVYSVENHPADSRVNVETIAIEGNGQRPSHKGDGYSVTDKSYTLNATEVHGVAYSFDPGASRDVGTLFIEECGKTLTNGTCPGHRDGVCIKQGARYIVRRLTPLECERLQGFPDNWTDIGEWTDTNGKKRQTSDAARYKALGNSIALPPWKWVLKRLCACYERDATMASLFDGIGGFPYLWEQLNSKGSCLWASEIEEFPIAVTKMRFGE